MLCSTIDYTCFRTRKFGYCVALPSMSVDPVRWACWALSVYLTRPFSTMKHTENCWPNNWTGYGAVHLAHCKLWTQNSPSEIVRICALTLKYILIYHKYRFHTWIGWSEMSFGIALFIGRIINMKKNKYRLFQEKKQEHRRGHENIRTRKVLT